MKKLKYLLQLVDGIWSVPLAFLSFYLIGVVLQSIFGYSTGTYDPGFIQPLFLASAVVIGATNIAVIGIYFTFRGLHRFLYGYKKGGGLINPSKEAWRHLTPGQQFLIAFGTFLYFVSAVLVVYLHLV